MNKRLDDARSVSRDGGRFKRPRATLAQLERWISEKTDGLADVVCPTHHVPLTCPSCRASEAASALNASRTPEQRSTSARKAVTARWAKRKAMGESKP